MKNSIFLFLILLVNLAYGKGCAGAYFIVGKAFDSNKTLLKNSALVIHFGEKVFNVQTDSQGRFEIEIEWKTICEGEGDINVVNPPFINIQNDDKNLKLENHWKKYADCFSRPKKQRTWKINLHFRKE